MMDITPIVQSIISLVAVIITCALIPYVKSKLTQDELNEVRAWTRIAVIAAEQLYKGNGRGEEKKAYVVKFLNDKGFKLDTESIDALIESYVKELT